MVGGVYCTRHPKTGVPRMIRATIIGAIGAVSPRAALLVDAAACGAAAITGFALLAHARATTSRMPRPGGA